MKNAKWTFMLMFFVSLFSFSALYAQFDEDEMIGEEKKEVSCIPENLTTNWDSLANKENDQDIRLLYSFGSEYYKNKSYKEALPYLWEVYLKDQGKYARNALRKIAEIYFNQGMVDSTLLICYRGLKRFPKEILLHHYAGLLQNRLGKFRCAIPHYEQLVAKDSTNFNYVKTLAFLYFKDDNEKCIEMQQIVVKLKPDDVEESNTLAQYISKYQGGEEVIGIRKGNWEKDPDNVSFAQSYAQVASNMGKYEEALAPLKKWIEKKPSTKAYLMRAEVYENLNKPDMAIQDYKTILKTEPKNVNVMLRIAENYRNSNKFSSARYWVRKALGAKPGYGQAYISMGEIYEAAVSFCSDGTKFEDKLVYELAKKEYLKAMKDPAFRAKAKKKISNVGPFLPTKEDRFMHRHDKIKSKCYSWILK